MDWSCLNHFGKVYRHRVAVPSFGGALPITTVCWTYSCAVTRDCIYIHIFSDEDSSLFYDVLSTG